jgi:hypothetical protein
LPLIASRISGLSFVRRQDDRSRFPNLAMAPLYLLVTCVLLSVLLLKWGIWGTIGAPARLLFFANSVYFFGLYFLLVPVPSEEIQYAAGAVLIFLTSFAAANQLVSKPRARAATTNERRILVVRPSLYWVYIAQLSIAVYLKYQEFGSFNIGTVFSSAYLASAGVAREAGSFVFDLVWSTSLWFVFILVLHAAIARQRSFFLCLWFVLLQTYYGAFSGTKSGVLLPSVYWLLLYWGNAFASGRRLMPNRHIALFRTKTMSVISLCIAAGAVAYLLVYLNEIRSGYENSGGFVRSFVARIDYVPTLAGYLQQYEYFNHAWPVKELLTNFFPSAIADALGFDKGRVSFDVAYTQFSYADARLSSSAGIGVAAINETLKPIGLDFPYFAACIAGLIAAALTEVVTRKIRLDLSRGSGFWFATLVPPLHIIAFFEPGPTLFFKLGLSLLLVFCFLIPILFVTGCVAFSYRRA